VRDAFDIVKRCLKDHAREQRDGARSVREGLAH
jgi:hypothetical protein